MNSPTILTRTHQPSPLFTKEELSRFLRFLEERENEQIEFQLEAQRKLKVESEIEGNEMERADRAIQNDVVIQLQRVTTELGKIARAKTRVRNGAYGVCMKSPCKGTGIVERERLEAIPHAEWCIKDAGCGPPRAR